jgi:leucyl aminopeptidase
LKGWSGQADSALDGAISRLIADGEIKAKKGEVTIIHTLGRIAPARVVVAGLGKREYFNTDVVRQVMGTTCQRLRATGVERVATMLHGAGIGGLSTSEAAQAVAEESLLGAVHLQAELQQERREGHQGVDCGGD